jgi:GNAT superfamily N-acetyltransferase
MNIEITPFDTRFLDQLDRLPPETWQSSAYELFMQNEWQPWFYPYQIAEGQKLLAFGMFFLFEDIAWLGWILVHQKFRCQGLGTQMSDFLVKKSSSLGAKTHLLTATELGAPIYEKLGFRHSGSYHFYTLPPQVKMTYDKKNIRPAQHSDLPDIFRLDQTATSEKRSAMLETFLDKTYVWIDQQVSGFFIESLGSGWIVAEHPEAGAQLAAFRNRAKNKLVIIPDGNLDYKEKLENIGYTLKHSIPRMVLGPEPQWKASMIYNRGAGYCG